MYDIIIAGGGPAGITAAIYAARAGLSAVCIERMFAGGQAATTAEIANYPGFANGISGVDFALALDAQAKNLGAEIITEEITSLELDGEIKRAVCQNAVYEAKNIILAMGAQPASLGLENEAKYIGAGVSYCATCDGAFYRGKEVCVVGGGDTAGEDALFLSKLASKVYIIHRRSEFRMQKKLQDELIAVKNIERVMNARVTKIIGADSVAGVEVDISGERREIAVSGIFMAVGIKPNSSLVPESIRNEQGFIETDEKMRTEIPGVYAAGDIRQKPLRQIVTACADGAIAVSAISAE